MKQWFVKSHWLHEDRIAYLEIIGDFDEEGMIEFNTHMRDKYLEQGDAPVHCIIDAKGLTGHPTNIKTLKEGTQASVKHPNIGWVVLVGFDNRIVRFFSSTVSQLLGVKFKLVDNLDDAKDVLRRADQSIAEFVK